MVFVLVFSQSVYAWTIADDPTGGDCTSIGIWKVYTKTCILQTDLSEGIVINSDNISLQCYGHSITYDPLDWPPAYYYGIEVLGRNGVTVRYCAISGFEGGILVSDSNNITLQGNSITSMSVGIEVSSSGNNTLQGNTVHAAIGNGIVLSSSNDNTLKDNTSDGNGGGSGIYLSYSDNNTLRGNTCNSNNGVGFLLNYSNNNYLSKNTADYNDFFGYVINGNDITLRRNECLGNFEGGSLPLGLCSPQQ